MILEEITEVLPVARLHVHGETKHGYALQSRLQEQNGMMFHHIHKHVPLKMEAIIRAAAGVQ